MTFFFFFLANKEASLLLKGCRVLPGSRECAFQQTDRVRHVRHHEWTAHGDIMTVTGSKMLTRALGIKLDTCTTLNFINNPECDIIFFPKLSVGSEWLWNYLKHLEILVLRHFIYYFLIMWVKSPLNSEYFLFSEKSKNPGVLWKKGPLHVAPWRNSQHNASGTVCPTLNDSHENLHLPLPFVYLPSIVFLSWTHVESSFPFGPPCVLSFTFRGH